MNAAGILDTGSGESRTAPVSKRAPRKSRSRGLRTRNGCLTCRKRHKKCDEQTPICGPCQFASRTCAYAQNPQPHAGHTETPSRLPPAAPATQGVQLEGRSSLPIPKTSFLDDPPSPDRHRGDMILDQEQIRQSTEIHLAPSFLLDKVGADGPAGPVAHLPHVADNQASTFVFSPDTGSITSDQLSTNRASTKWLDLLAQDAALADTTFSLAPTPNPRSSLEPEGGGDGIDHTRATLEGFSEALRTQQYAWQEAQDIVLLPHERTLFHNFADKAASWLDILDRERHFATYVIRLALRNLGLMKAILAVSARHAAAQEEVDKGDQPRTSSSKEHLAIQYYYETLHYLQSALQYSSYTFSEEILATAIIISTYEMLDESASNWRRHLRGVFWIQRSQDSDGASGGLRQAVWWAWLRQDIWAALREKRKCFSFWKPVKGFPELQQHELACYSVYLLSQAVNFAATAQAGQDRERSRENGARLTEDQLRHKGDELLSMFERWESCLGLQFRPLPPPELESTNVEQKVFQPVWIHPPDYAIAIMIYNFAKILVTLLRPAEPGFGRYAKMRKTLSAAVDTICGVTITLQESGSQVIAARCLFGAGLCAQEQPERDAILSLMNTCEKRSGWPMVSIRNALHDEWRIIDGEV